MSLMYPYTVTDREGRRHAATLADCLNVQRTPAARQQVLDRQLPRVAVEGGALQVEKAFVYLDAHVARPSWCSRHESATAMRTRMRPCSACWANCRTAWANSSIGLLLHKIH